MDLHLANKTALVTGGASGLGAAIARTLAREVARVAIADLRLDAAKKLADEIHGLPIKMDVSSRRHVESALKKTADKLGPVQILVSNVGLTLPDHLHDMADDDIDTTFAVNMRGPLLLTRAAASAMRQNNWGRLLYIGSVSGLKASAGLALYSASKYFLHGLAVAAGLELGKHGVTANILCPSDIYPHGDLPAGSWLNPKLVEISLRKEGVKNFAELKSKRIARNPVPRSCTVEDVAELAAFLCSPLADFINAQVIGINGGSVPN